MEVRFYKVPSQSDPNKVHTVRRMPDDSFLCSCPAFVFKKECKHAEEVREKCEQSAKEWNESLRKRDKLSISEIQRRLRERAKTAPKEKVEQVTSKDIAELFYL